MPATLTIQDLYLGARHAPSASSVDVRPHAERVSARPSRSAKELAMNALEACRARLRELAALPPGWDGDDSQPVHAASLSAAEAFLTQRPPIGLTYKFYPMQDGGLLLEFVAGRWDLSLEFQPTGAVELFGVEVDGPGELVPQKFERLNVEFLKVFDGLKEGPPQGAEVTVTPASATTPPTAESPMWRDPRGR